MNAAATKYDGVTKYIRITDIDEESHKFRSDAITSPDEEAADQFILHKGDIVFARTGASVGKSYLYNEADGNLAFAGFLIRFSICSKQANPFFIFLRTQTQKYWRWVKVYSMRSGQPGINAEEYKTFPVHTPSLPEQEKIAAFLTSVDDRIDQLKRKKSLLQDYKKGAMQKLFSQELRFKDEQGKDFPDWEEKKLGEVAEVNPRNTDLPSEFLYIDLESVKKGQLSTPDLISKEDAPSRAQRVLNKDDILYQTVRPYQKNNYYFDLDGTYVASTGYAQLRTLESPQFVYQLLHTTAFLNQVLRRCTGTSYPAINSSDLGGIQINIPSIPEQTKIANFLSTLDHKIEQVDTQITQSQTFKKGLLQQMFV